MIMSIFKHYKAVNELVMGPDSDLIDLDAPVKIELTDGTELVITDIEMVTNPETDEQVVWLKAVEDQ
jgi:hypothetical protein